MVKLDWKGSEIGEIRSSRSELSCGLRLARLAAGLGT